VEGCGISFFLKLRVQAFNVQTGKEQRATRAVLLPQVDITPILSIDELLIEAKASEQPRFPKRKWSVPIRQRNPLRLLSRLCLSIFLPLIIFVSLDGFWVEDFMVYAF
jgi:hypothetical protein